MRLRVRPGIHRFFLVLGLLVVGWSTAQALGPAPVKNWAAPSSWTPPSARATGRSALVTYPPLPFIPITPCRVADTRGNGFTGTYGPPSMAGGVSRNFTITGQCGIPALAQAVSFNFTVTNTAGPGHLLVFPQGGSQPTVSTLNYLASQTIANAAVVPLGTGGGLTAIPGVSGFDLIVDVNGYYSQSTIASGYPFAVSGPRPSTGVIIGYNAGLTFPNWGQGVVGYADGSYGSSGVLGYVPDIGFAYGVKGRVGSNHFNGYPSGSWGVVGAGGVGGVWGSGDSTKYTNTVGVMGSFTNGGDVTTGGGKLAYKAGASTYGVFSEGDFGGTGAKFFVEPHPTDADKVIRYVALEGPEAGTYFRGTARTSGKKAVIEVPESFRIVTDEEGLTVQLTPIGELAILAVVDRDLNRIVIRSSAEVSFDYHVHGVRRAFKAHEAISEGSEFRPTSPSSRLPSYLPEEARKRLVENGTYNRDGTINLGTAQRHGWTKVWEEEARQKSAD